jgi:hypothetical protein
MQAPEKASTQWAAGVLAHAISPPGAGHMVIDIVFYVGLSATIIAGLDIFLSEQQKRWLDGKVFQLWNWLDDCKRVSLLVWLRKLSRLGVFAVAILLSCALILWIWRASPTPRGDPTEFYGTIFVILLLASIFGTLIIRGALKSTTLPRALLRITIYAILCLTPFYAFLYWTSTMVPALSARPPFTLLQILFVLSFFAVTIFTAFMLIFWSSVAVPIIYIYVIGFLLFVFEFIVRRIAEYPKGVLIAMSALMASLFAFVGVFK